MKDSTLDKKKILLKDTSAFRGIVKIYDEKNELVIEQKFNSFCRGFVGGHLRHWRLLSSNVIKKINSGALVEGYIADITSNDNISFSGLDVGTGTTPSSSSEMYAISNFPATGLSRTIQSAIASYDEVNNTSKLLLSRTFLNISESDISIKELVFKVNAEQVGGLISFDRLTSPYVLEPGKSVNFSIELSFDSPFTKNILATIAAMYWYKSLIRFTAIDGSNFAHASSYTNVRAQGTANDYTKGIVIGSGSDQGQAITNYRLQSLINTGIQMGPMTCEFVAKASKCLGVMFRTFTNITEENIEVKEVGLYVETNHEWSSSTYKTVMLYRKVLDSPLIIPPGVTQAISMSLFTEFTPDSGVS